MTGAVERMRMDINRLALIAQLLGVVLVLAVLLISAIQGGIVVPAGAGLGHEEEVIQNR